MTWSLAEAKSKFSEVMNRTESEGPQKITRRGKVFILIEESTYLESTGEKPSFVDFLMSGEAPNKTNSAPSDRPNSFMRKVEL